jgi:hypothetical protein
MIMTTKNVVILEKDQNQDTLQVAITIANTWDDFDKLVQFLMRQYDAQVVQKHDGPYARRWIMSAKGRTIEMWHDDPYGNYLVAPTSEAEPLVREIAQELEERLRGLHEEQTR